MSEIEEFERQRCGYVLPIRKLSKDIQQDLAKNSTFPLFAEKIAGMFFVASFFYLLHYPGMASLKFELRKRF